MQGFFNFGFNTTSLSHQSEYQFQANPTYMDNQRLLSLLFGHKDLIEKLLENQNILKTRLQGPIIAQTTDTQHQAIQSDNSDGNFQLQRLHDKFKKSQNILLKRNIECIPLERKGNKKMIQIVSSCPIDGISITQQLQQKDEKKQFKIHSQSNKKCCQTKNIIKNYGKSILMFFRRNRSLVKKILDQFQIDETQFYVEFEGFKDRVNSITELKSFWTQQGNRFAQIYRIVSNIYLKKYSLRHTFSSRVRNFAVHIKYRKRLLDVLKSPEDFNSIKYL